MIVLTGLFPQSAADSTHFENTVDMNSPEAYSRIRDVLESSTACLLGRLNAYAVPTEDLGSAFSSGNHNHMGRVLVH